MNWQGSIGKWQQFYTEGSVPSETNYTDEKNAQIVIALLIMFIDRHINV